MDPCARNSRGFRANFLPRPTTTTTTTTTIIIVITTIADPYFRPSWPSAPAPPDASGDCRVAMLRASTLLVRPLLSAEQAHVRYDVRGPTEVVLLMIIVITISIATITTERAARKLRA